MEPNQTRALVLALFQSIACILTFALDIFAIPGGVSIPGFSGLTLISIAQASRLISSLGGFDLLGAGSLTSTLEGIFRGGEAALAFTSIGLICAFAAGAMPLAEIQGERKWYQKPAPYFFLSGICGLAPFGYALGIFLSVGGFDFGAAFFTSIVMVVLGIFFGCIENANSNDEEPAVLAVAYKA